MCCVKVVVPHVERVETVVEVEQEEIRELTVEIPQTHTIRNIRYVPKFETEAGSTLAICPKPFEPPNRPKPPQP